MQKGKMVAEEVIQIAEKREAKGKGEKERCTHPNTEFQRLARRDTCIPVADSCWCTAKPI